MSLPKPWSEPTPVDSELLAELKRGVVEYDEAVIISVCQTIIDRRMDAYMAIFEGLVAGMDEVGLLFDCQEYFVPELLMCADTLYAGLDMLKPHIKRSVGGAKSKGHVIIGSIEGDIHDIGKNMVKTVFEIAGFTIHDLGCDTPISRFVKETIKTDSPLVLVSSMMTTCQPRVKELVKKIKKAAPNTCVMVGGAFVNEDTLEEMGADGGGKNAHGALREALRMLSVVQKIEDHEHEFHKPFIT